MYANRAEYSQGLPTGVSTDTIVIENPGTESSAFCRGYYLDGRKCSSCTFCSAGMCRRSGPRYMKGHVSHFSFRSSPSDCRLLDDRFKYAVGTCTIPGPFYKAIWGLQASSLTPPSTPILSSTPTHIPTRLPTRQPLSNSPTRSPTLLSTRQPESNPTTRPPTRPPSPTTPNPTLEPTPIPSPLPTPDPINPKSEGVTVGMVRAGML